MSNSVIKVKIDTTGRKINHWKVLEELGRSKILCQCKCGTVKELYKKAVLEGRSKSCGCMSGQQKHDIIGQKINHWTVLAEVGNGRIICQCDCEEGTIKEIYKKALLNGSSKSCGCARGFYNSKTKSDGGYYKKLSEDTTEKYKNMTFGEWEVIEAIPNTNKLLCRCSCGNVREVFKSHLINGGSRSCGCKQIEHTKETMVKRYGEVSPKHIDKPREQWQIDIISSKDNFEAFINEYKQKNNGVAYSNDLIGLLNISATHLLRKIHEYSLEDMITTPKDSVSYIENLIYKYIINNTSFDIIRGSRSIISPYELDMYIPEIKVAIEVNGDYWHSSIYKDNKYHKSKNLMCMNKGIRLLNIYEYEMHNKPEKVKNIIDNILNINQAKIYARDCEILEISDSDGKEFENLYHMDNATTADIRIGLKYKNEIIAEMTFGKPRFDTNYTYELIRLVFKSGINVIGGSERLFKHAVDKYNLDNIITYCNLDKFSGKVYDKLGFKFIGITDPGYVWVKHCTHEVLRRYQTQKHKLVELGFGNENQTEDEIMSDLDYFKIYNSGNAKYEYIRKE